jgi:spermidine synthase
MAPQRRRQPTSYYAEASGVGRLLTALADRPIDVGAIGLGAGTIATYGKAGDRYRFYEIDEAIVAAAHRHFTFIADSPAAVDVQVGDGRLLLQREGERRFDVIVVDAFSGDSIPVHLLTREAVALYRDRLKPGGVIALHVSNTHLELAPVVAGIAAELGLQASFIADPGVAGDVSKSNSDWVLLAADRSILDLPAIAAVATPLPRASAGHVWTDDYSNIVQVMSFGRGARHD